MATATAAAKRNLKKGRGAGNPKNSREEGLETYYPTVIRVR